MPIPPTTKKRLISLRAKEKQLATEIRNGLRNEGKKFPIVYLPNPEPDELAEVIFVTMEPSLGSWARTEKEAEQRISEGLLNFLLSWEDFIFHYTAVNCLKRPYLITDVSKMAMRVPDAEGLWKSLYPKWFPLLEEEIDIAGVKGCLVIPVGNRVDNFLRKNNQFFNIGEKILHYSPNAAGARNQISQSPDHKEKFMCFCKEISQKTILNFAEVHLAGNDIPGPMQDWILGRLKKSPRDISLSRKKLLYTYKILFEKLC